MTEDAARPRPSRVAPEGAAEPSSWRRVLELDQLPAGRVTTVTVDHRTYAATHVDGGYGLLDDRCPHQGGPLGEGSIEKGWLRCPWHGFDYSPCNGAPPPPFDDAPAAYPVEVRDDGVYALLPDPTPLAACFGIAGPGSTNLLTGLYDAEVDRAPVLALSGGVPSAQAGRGAFQDLDLVAAFADVARYQATLRAGSDHAELVAMACKTALVERGVAHLEFPDEVQTLPAAEDAVASAPTGRIADRAVAPPPAVLQEAADLLAGAERPLFVLGAGARDGIDGIRDLAEQLGAPMVTTFKAKGLVSDAHELAGGVLGRSGTPIASWFMNEADLIVAWGASFSNHTGIAPYKPIVQVDRDPMARYLGSIGFALPAALGAWAAVRGEREVVSISGDGGFGQYAMELTTAVKHGMPIRHILLDNDELAKISKEQRAGEWAVWQTGLVNPDFADFARSCG
ncbi:MAG: thiamine pyrophosphate-dependent enzyme, partial [Trueperaceae bacterium]